MADENTRKQQREITSTKSTLDYLYSRRSVTCHLVLSDKPSTDWPLT